MTGVICASEPQMPFTPFHFGPSGFVGLIFRKWIDIPVFVLANVAMDLEPGIVLLFGLDYPAHSLCHTFLFGTVIGLAWGLLAYPMSGLFGWLMRLFALSYKTSLPRMLLSSVLGVWLHVLLDSFCWPDVKPFWPLRRNPFLDLLTVRTVYMLCVISFIPAFLLYIFIVLCGVKKTRNGQTIRRVT